MSKKNLTISEYLIQSLEKANIEHVFGIPGDYVIKFFSILEKSSLNIVTTCSEQGAAFAADAYARINGLSALCVTYCVGGLNAINAVAGAYAEKAPMIVISGAPGISERNQEYLLHHSIKDFDSQFNMFKEVTVASTKLDDPYTAAYEIDRVIKACLKHKRPVYIELPRDMVNQECSIPHENFTVKKETLNKNFEAAVEEAAEMINNSKTPVILGGVEIKRYGLEKEFTELLDKSGLPYCTTLLGKSIINESHPQYLGIYMGKLCKEEVRKEVEKSDCVIILGDLMTDMNMGTAQIDVSKTIFASTDEFSVKYHYYKDIDLKNFIKALTPKLNKVENKKVLEITKNEEFKIKPDEKITSARFFERLNNFLKPGTDVICDVGDCLFGSSQLTLPANSCYLGPAYYTSMGYGIPACIGVTIKNPSLKPVVIVGDGAFQMTGHEVSCFVKYNLKPVIFVINNHGYTTQRFITDGSYNEVNVWNYHLFPQIVGGGMGIEVKTEAELEEALNKIENNNNSFSIINVHLDKYDGSETLQRLTKTLSNIANN